MFSLYALVRGKKFFSHLVAPERSKQATLFIETGLVVTVAATGAETCASAVVVVGAVAARWQLSPHPFRSHAQFSRIAQRNHLRVVATIANATIDAVLAFGAAAVAVAAVLLCAFALDVAPPSWQQALALSLLCAGDTDR